MFDRTFALVGSRDQWLRCTHEGTHLDADGTVRLAWSEADSAGVDEGDPPGGAAGLAFDGACRLYRSSPDEGEVVRHGWSSRGARKVRNSDGAASLSLFESPLDSGGGGFRPRDTGRGPLREPRGLAVDDEERLFVAEAGAGRVLVYDLRTRQLLRSISVAPDRPLDVASTGTRVLVLTTDPLVVVEVTAREVVRRLPLRTLRDGPEPPTAPERLAVSNSGRVALLDRPRTDLARVLLLDREKRLDPDDEPGFRIRRAVATPGATDVAFDGNERLVVARGTGQDFLRYAFEDGAPVSDLPLRAKGYDGRGIVRTPDGRVLFWTARGPAHAVAARVRYGRQGKVVTFRLDSGVYGTHWGRLYLEACVPDGCGVRVATIVTDEPPEGSPLSRTPPDAEDGSADVDLTGQSPPMPPASLVLAAETRSRPFHRRNGGSELPWAADPDDRFRVFEAPIPEGPGRYLWVVLTLSGNTRHTPLVRNLRAHHPGHGLLERLPRVFSRDRRAASFLRRYLSLADGFLSELDGAAAQREVLLDPWAAPDAALPWLASFLGLVLDDRWPESVRRTAIDEAPWLFRNRGTVRGLRRFVEIYTGPPVIVVEHFRLRSLGGELVGDRSPAFSRSVLGAGLRVGGEVGSRDPEPLTGDTTDAFRTHAHRFTVLVGRGLSDSERDVVTRILDVHRPAHTTMRLCTADHGMRVGRGLHVGLSSFVGGSAGFDSLRVGSSTVGGTGVLGRPGPGTRIGQARLGHDSEVG